MLYFNFTCPPVPHLIVGGISMFRKGDIHERRIIYNTFDLIFVRSGRLYMEENDQKFMLEPGQFLILPPGNIHKGYKCCETDTNFSWIHFYTEGKYFYSKAPDTHTMQKMNKNKYYKKEDFNISIPQYGSVAGEGYNLMEKYMDNISQVKIDKYHHAKLFYSSSISQIEYQIVFLKILAIICESSQEPASKNVAADLYDYFSLNYQKAFCLADISKQYSYHPAHIIRCIKREYGFTPLQLLLNIRINAAKNLLKSTELQVNRIVEEVGFSDASYFSKQFRSIVGMTPLEYRKISQKLNNSG